MEVRSDNKPMTVRNLRIILDGELRRIKAKDPTAVTKYLDSPIIMSSDEEGNDMLKLYGVEASEEGVTLWPAHFE